MCRRTLATVALLGALSALPSNAFASPITATQLLSFSLTDTPETAAAASTTLQLGQFDASLGTLTEVILSIGAPSNVQSLVLHALGNQASVTGAALALAINGIPLVPSFPIPTMSNVCTVCNFGPFDLIFSLDSTLKVTYPVDSQPTLGVPFIGSGLLPLVLSAQAMGTAQNATVTGMWTGDVRLDYTYEPTPVPEPASLLLVGTGVSVVAWRRRRRVTVGRES